MFSHENKCSEAAQQLRVFYTRSFEYFILSPRKEEKSGKEKERRRVLFLKLWTAFLSQASQAKVKWGSFFLHLLRRLSLDNSSFSETRKGGKFKCEKPDKPIHLLQSLLLASDPEKGGKFKCTKPEESILLLQSCCKLWSRERREIQMWETW